MVRYLRFLRRDPGWRARDGERDEEEAEWRRRLRPLALDMDRLEYLRGRRSGLSSRLIRRRKGERDLERDRLVEIVATESTDDTDRDRALRGEDASACGLRERRSCSFLALASARTSSATPLLRTRSAVFEESTVQPTF